MAAQIIRILSIVAYSFSCGCLMSVIGRVDCRFLNA